MNPYKRTLTRAAYNVFPHMESALKWNQHEAYNGDYQHIEQFTEHLHALCSRQCHHVHMSHRILQGEDLKRTVGANDEVIDTTFTDREGNETTERYYNVTEREAADIKDFESLETRKVWVHRTDDVTTFVCNEPEDLKGLSVEYQVLNIIRVLGTGVDDTNQRWSEEHERHMFDTDAEEEEEEEEELSLSARAWGCWLSDSLWVGPPVSRAP